MEPKFYHGSDLSPKMKHDLSIMCYLILLSLFIYFYIQQVFFMLSFYPTAMCLPPNPPANGRMLGQVFRVGHEVHFLCNPGFQLSGPETKKCLESLNWSGEEPTCNGAYESRILKPHL